jgi:predicted esterase
MKKTRLTLIGLLVLAVWHWCTRDPVVHAPTFDVHFGYVVRHTGGGSAGDRLPLLIALYGDGGRADRFFDTALDDIRYPARVILVKGPVERGAGEAWPDSPRDFMRYGGALDEAVEFLVRKYRTVGEPVLLGFSGGARMAFYQAARYGDSYSSIFAISGRIQADQLGESVVRSSTVVRAYHGRSDEVIPLGGGRSSVELLRSRGVHAELTEFDGGHHGLFSDIKPMISRAVERQLAMVDQDR